MTDNHNMGASAERGEAGRSLRDGLSPSVEPCGLAGSAASIPSAGHWVIYEGDSYARFVFKRALVDKVTPQQLAVSRNTGWGKRIRRATVIACVATEEEAALLNQSLDGVSGEFSRRRRAAEDERTRRVTEADAAARKQVARIVASAMSARSAETEGLSPQDASVVPQADAQAPEVSS